MNAYSSKPGRTPIGSGSPEPVLLKHRNGPHPVVQKSREKPGKGVFVGAEMFHRAQLVNF